MQAQKATRANPQTCVVAHMVYHLASLPWYEPAFVTLDHTITQLDAGSTSLAKRSNAVCDCALTVRTVVSSQRMLVPRTVAHFVLAADGRGAPP